MGMKAVTDPSTTCRIFTVAGKRVVLDSDLAALYGVETRRLNEQVRRNPDRFPQDFAFLLSTEDWEALRSQFAILKPGRGQHRKFLPYVFTEHGALMAAGVLNSPDFGSIESSDTSIKCFKHGSDSCGRARSRALRTDCPPIHARQYTDACRT